MDISKIKDAKLQLEDEIRDLILNFESKTGTEVFNLSLQTENVTSMSTKETRRILTKVLTVVGI